MIDYDAIKRAPLDNIDYFSHWGGRPWRKFVDIAVEKYFDRDLAGKKVLEIGPGRGRMSSFFAVMGAEVTSIEVEKSRLEQAQETVNNFGLADQVNLILYNGDLKTLDRNKYDLVFTKSALICVSDLAGFLIDLNELLHDESRVIFIENGRGNLLMQLLRLIKGRGLDFLKRIHHFTQADLDLIKSLYEIELLMHSKWPPVYLICGKKH
jgi:protein-L-isoaspartate O-methyltransferase